MESMTCSVPGHQHPASPLLENMSLTTLFQKIDLGKTPYWDLNVEIRGKENMTEKLPNLLELAPS